MGLTGTIPGPAGIPMPIPVLPANTGGQSASGSGSGLPPEFDPWKDTIPIATMPPFFPTQDPKDCDKQFDDDVSNCKSTCSPVSFSRLTCIAMALIKYRMC